ncbi:aminobutyraldehyde dehydrogenase [Paenarthrobacter sp. NPDC057355]|uniref:aminobutyraldehyde dehydrogenase n=1 Tax=Paenarthrobacter sp. NPDC057355 TaxID=3346105 RepID=UPI00362B105A
MTTIQSETFTVHRAEGTSNVSAILPPTGHFINGSFVPATVSGNLIDVVNPATEEIITSVQAGTAADVDAAVAAAVEAQKTWGATTPKERADVLNLIANIIEDNRAAFEVIESANTGKPRAVAEDDVTSTIDTFRFMAGASRTLTSMAGGDYATDHTSVILREPVGVVGVITPWNYPLLMAAWKIAPILAAGNSIVMKPSEQTPLSTLKLVELLAGRIPDGILNVVTGQGRTVGQRLSEHPDIALVALTGSVVSGQAVAKTAARSVKRVHLELGGKAPVVVFPDADLQAAAAGVRNAGYWNAGQDCGAACRVLVHESVAEEFTQYLAEEVGSLVVGAPDAGEAVEMGPMISRPHFERVKEALAEARSAGLTIAVGGSALEGTGFFIEPTVITGVPAGAPIATHEIFGPVVTVETFSTTEEAVRRANESPYGLSASVWTRDSSLSLRVPKQLDFGTVWVNAHLVLANEVPWGGFKGSGYGRDLSLYALDDYSRTKHVMINHGA